MVGVTNTWKQIHEQPLLNETFVEVAMEITDPDAVADATLSDNGHMDTSEVSTVTEEGTPDSIPTYGTLEQNLWVLDGTYSAVSTSGYGAIGFVSDVLCNSSGYFTTKNPTLTFDFSSVFNTTLPGITITWSKTYDEFADTFSVRAYNGGTLVAEKVVRGNLRVESVVLLDMTGYDCIVISIEKWCLPLHRARVEGIYLGINKVYDKSKLVDFSHKQTADILSISLPMSEVQFSINNVNGEYNPYNLEGFSKYLNERQRITVRYGLRRFADYIEWIRGGTFYLSEWQAKQNGLTADFKARDLLEFMSRIIRDEAISVQSRSLYNLAQTVISQLELPKDPDGGTPFRISSSLRSKFTTAPLPEDTAANCLQLIANAGECSFYIDRNGKICILPWDESYDTDYKIDSFNTYTKPEIIMTKPIKQVDVKYFTYTKGDRGFESTTELVTIDVGTEGEIITIDNPLITSADHATSVGNRMATHLSHRMSLDFSWRADPRLDALDIIQNENAYTTNRVCMTEINYKFNGTFRGTGKGKVM